MDCQVQSLYRNCHDVRNRQASPVHGPRSGDARTNCFGGRRSRLGEGRRPDEPRRRHGDERRQQVSALPLLRRQGRALARSRDAADEARTRYAWAVARLARFARRLAPLAGRSPCAEQSGRLPVGRACLSIAPERQRRAKCRGRRARDVATGRSRRGSSRCGTAASCRATLIRPASRLLSWRPYRAVCCFPKVKSPIGLWKPRSRWLSPMWRRTVRSRPRNAGTMTHTEAGQRGAPAHWRKTLRLRSRLQTAAERLTGSRGAWEGP